LLQLLLLLFLVIFHIGQFLRVISDIVKRFQDGNGLKVVLRVVAKNELKLIFEDEAFITFCIELISEELFLLAKARVLGLFLLGLVHDDCHYGFVWAILWKKTDLV